VAATPLTERWRDPDSNRGHHDFQAATVSAKNLRKSLQTLGAVTVRRGGRCTPIASDRVLFGPRVRAQDPLTPFGSTGPSLPHAPDKSTISFPA
jgi:hypothetical protein